MVQTRDLGQHSSGPQESVEIGGQGDVGAFVGMWRGRVAKFYSKYMATADTSKSKQ